MFIVLVVRGWLTAFSTNHSVHLSSKLVLKSRNVVNSLQARNQGGGARLVRTNPPRDHVGPLGPFFLYVFRKLDCHNFSLLFKLHEI